MYPPKHPKNGNRHLRTGQVQEVDTAWDGDTYSHYNSHGQHVVTYVWGDLIFKGEKGWKLPQETATDVKK